MCLSIVTLLFNSRRCFLLEFFLRTSRPITKRITDIMDYTLAAGPGGGCHDINIKDRYCFTSLSAQFLQYRDRRKPEAGTMPHF